MSTLASDLVIELENKPGALAKVATAISDAGVNIAAATCMGNGNTAELHILVPHSEPVYRALANTHGPTVTRLRLLVLGSGTRGRADQSPPKRAVAGPYRVGRQVPVLLEGAVQPGKVARRDSGVDMMG